MSLFPTLAWGLSWEVQPLDQEGLKREPGEQEAAGGKASVHPWAGP